MRKILVVKVNCDCEKKSLKLMRDLFKKYKIKTTLAVAGCEIRKNLNMLKKLMDDGHEMATHSYSHFINFKKLSFQEKLEELKYSKFVHKKSFGINPKGFVPPYGFIDNETINILNDLDFKWTTTFNPTNSMNITFQLPIFLCFNDFLVLDHGKKKVIDYQKRALKKVKRLAITEWHCINFIGITKIRYSLPTLKSIIFSKSSKNIDYETSIKRKIPQMINYYKEFLDYALSNNFQVMTMNKTVDYFKKRKLKVQPFKYRLLKRKKQSLFKRLNRIGLKW